MESNRMISVEVDCLSHVLTNRTLFDINPICSFLSLTVFNLAAWPHVGRTTNPESPRKRSQCNANQSMAYFEGSVNGMLWIWDHLLGPACGKRSPYRRIRSSDGKQYFMKL